VRRVPLLFQTGCEFRAGCCGRDQTRESRRRHGRRKAVRNDDRRVTSPPAFQGRRDQGLGLAIDRTQGIIQNQDQRLFQQTRRARRLAAAVSGQRICLALRLPSHSRVRIHDRVVNTGTRGAWRSLRRRRRMSKHQVCLNAFRYKTVLHHHRDRRRTSLRSRFAMLWSVDWILPSAWS